MKEYHARLTVYGLSKMSAATRKRLAKWLMDQTRNLYTNPKGFGHPDRYVAKLMK